MLHYSLLLSKKAKGHQCSVVDVIDVEMIDKNNWLETIKVEFQGV